MADPKTPGLGDDLLKAAAKSPIQAIKGAAISTLKSGVQKINPFDKKINTSDVSDTGIESLRLGYTTAKQGKNAVKTTAQTIKTTQRTIKTAGRAAKETTKVVIRVVKTTVRVTAATAKLVGKAVAYIASAIPAPILIILAAAIILLILMMGAIILTAGGVAGGKNATRNAYENALGLDDLAEDYADGVSFYSTAMNQAKSAFEAKIDALLYDETNLAHSDLVYFTRSSPGNPNAKLEHSELATDAIKTQIKDTWLPCLTEQEVLAIAYVYLQKQENDTQGTNGALYEVEYTQDVLNEVVGKLYAVTETVYEKQQCPGKDCDTHKVVNPAWTQCDEKMGEAAQIINGEKSGDVEQARKDYENWLAAREAYPHYIDEAYCPKLHDNHSIALTFYDKTSVLMQLGINEIPYAEWVELTITGFENSEEIP